MLLPQQKRDEPAVTVSATVDVKAVLSVAPVAARTAVVDAAVAAAAVVSAAAKPVSDKPKTALELLDLFDEHFAANYWHNPQTNKAMVIVHPNYRPAVKALGVDPDHPLILWQDLDHASGPITLE